jgi:hypothetical protein
LGLHKYLECFFNLGFSSQGILYLDRGKPGHRSSQIKSGPSSRYTAYNTIKYNWDIQGHYKCFLHLGGCSRCFRYTNYLDEETFFDNVKPAEKLMHFVIAPATKKFCLCNKIEKKVEKLDEYNKCSRKDHFMIFQTF